MSTAAASIHTTSTLTTTRKRLLIRREGGGAPFVWSGLLPLLGLLGLAWYLLWPWARHDIEAHVREGVNASLHAKSMHWVSSSVSGQHVLLTGTPPDAAAGEQALALARATQCPTWLGMRTCPVQVLAQFDAAKPAAPPPAPPPAPVAAAVPPPAPAPAVAAAQACEKSLADLVTGSRIEFASASAQIQAKSMSLLDKLAEAAKTCPGSLAVNGHTDNIGNADYNLALSKARAESVRKALVQRGLAGERIQAEGFGLTQPLDSNATAEGRAKNRRIEFKASAS